MIDMTARVISLFCVGLAAGIAVCVLLTERDWHGAAQFYTELKQLWIRALTVPAPALGAIGLAAMLIDDVLLFTRGLALAFWLVAAAVLLNLAALLLTRLGHFPINDRIRTWDPANPPADWRQVQARWAGLHAGRTVCAVGSFVLLVIASVVRA